MGTDVGAGTHIPFVRGEQAGQPLGFPPLWGLCLWRPCLGVQPAETAEPKGGFTTAHLHSKTAARQGLKRGLEALMASPSQVLSLFPTFRPTSLSSVAVH